MSEPERSLPSKQEMFDRAVRGLRSQGWQMAINESGGCAYETCDGKRCAWGWVDRTVGPEVAGTVRSLRSEGIGLAARLEYEDISFASAMQGAHDGAENDAPPDNYDHMEQRFRRLGEKWGLSWPAE